MNPFLFHSTDAPAFHSIPSQPGPEVEMNTATPPSAAPYGIERPFGSDLDISKEDDEARQEDSDATPTKRRGSVSTTSGSAVGAEGGRVISDKAVARITRTRSKSARQRGQASAPSARRRRGARQDAQYSDEVSVLRLSAARAVVTTV